MLASRSGADDRGTGHLPGGRPPVPRLLLLARGGVTRLVLDEPSLCLALPGLLREHKAAFAEARETAGDDPAFGALTKAACDEALRWLGEVVDG